MTVKKDPSACSKTGCLGVTSALCGYPLRGRKAGQVCGARVCRAHATGKGAALRCPPHARLEAAREGAGRP